MLIFRLPAVLIKFYLLGCGILANVLAIGFYWYAPHSVHLAYQKTVQLLKTTRVPAATTAQAATPSPLLDQEIASNFDPWQPLPDNAKLTSLIKIGDMTYGSPKAALAQLQDNQLMLIGAGTYHEPLVIRQNNVKIVGSGRVIFDGITAEGKATIIAKGKNITLSNIECKNIAVPDKNGACIRAEGNGLTVDHVYFHDSEQGILSNGNQLITINDSRFEKLGKNGYAHGIYIGGGELHINSSLFIAAVSEGHEIKSRASKTIIKDSVIASLSAIDSRLVDIPNGGELVIENSVLEKGPQSTNPDAIGYGLEGIKAIQNSITLTKNVFVLEREAHNVLLHTQPEQQPPTQITGNMIVSKDDLDISGLNWLYASRQEAKMPAYPKLPVLENSPQTTH